MILLSFDIEEFDMPFEYGRDIDFTDQIDISRRGTSIILDILREQSVKATFFCTATFALNDPDTIRRMIADGHEVASHGYYHSDFKPEHLLSSRKVLEEITGEEVAGFRMARMMPVDEKEIAKAGYVYNTSLNPTYLPGRYNNFSKPRTCFMKEGVLQIPASVTPLIRFPLFWLAFHNLPGWIYRGFCKWALAKDGYLNLYFHPWEFTELNDKARFNFPGYVSRNSGEKMAERMRALIGWMKKEGYEFGTFKEFIARREEG
jgi:hypothetical protein